MSSAPAQQSSSPNEEAPYLAKMEPLLALHAKEGWNDESLREAQDLLGEWFELPCGDDDDEEDSYQIPDLANRLWDLCDQEAEVRRLSGDTEPTQSFLPAPHTNIHDFGCKLESCVMQNYADLAAFKGPVGDRCYTAKELLMMDFSSYQEDEIGHVYHEAQRLAWAWRHIDRTSKEWHENSNYLSKLWLALQGHVDNDNSAHNESCKQQGWTDLLVEGNYDFEPIEQFQARLLLAKGRFPVLRRNEVDGVTYEEAAKYNENLTLETQTDRLNKFRLTPLEQLEIYRSGSLRIDSNSVVESSGAVLNRISCQWELIKLMPSPTQRMLAHQQLRKEMGMPAKEYKQLMHSLLIEKSDENVQLTTVEAVRSAASECNARAVVDRFMMSGAVSILAAEGGCGKTALMYAAAEAISTGQPLFGELQTLQGHVLVVEADENWRNAARKWNRMDFNPNSRNISFLWAWDPSKMLELEQSIVTNKSAAVLMDSFATLFGGGGESMNDAEMGLYLYELNQMAARTGAAIMVTHHLKKGASKDGKGNSKPIVLGDLFGSSYIVNGASDVWGLWRTDDDGQYFRLRYLKDRSMLVERNFDFELSGSEESLRFDIHSACLDRLDEQKTIRLKVLGILRGQPGKWFTIESLTRELWGSTKFGGMYSDRSIRRGLLGLYEDAPKTGVSRRKVNTGKRGRPLNEYAYVR